MTTRASRPVRSLVDGPDGPVEYLTTGSGSPHTVFAHGLAGSIDTTRPFGSGVPGSRTFLHFRGHGASAAPDGSWTYAALAGDLAAVADHVVADRALGVSMGAGALCALLADRPDRFRRVVLMLPAVLDQPRSDAALERLVTMARLADDRDVDGVTGLLLLEQPAEVRDDPAVQTWCRRQARTLVGTPAAGALRALPHAVPLGDRDVLRAVTAPVLVVAQEDDPTHPVWVARQLAGILPNARLEVLPPGGVLWRHRSRVRGLLRDFLSGPVDR